MTEPITRHGSVRSRLNLLTHTKKDPLDTIMDSLADFHFYLSRRQNYLKPTDYGRKILLQGLLLHLRTTYGSARELEESMAKQHLSFKPKRRSRRQDNNGSSPTA